MRRLYFDTETSGLPPKDPKTPLDKCPHVVQLAAILTDSAFNEIHSINVIIKPDGWTVGDEAAKVTGITTEAATVLGVPGIIPFGYFSNLCKLADELVAHNIVFDSKLMRYEMERLNKPTRHLQLPQVCTMLATTNICKIPGRYRGKYKWPKLEEAYQYFFGEMFDNSHDALADVRATIRLHRHLIENNLI